MHLALPATRAVVLALLAFPTYLHAQPLAPAIPQTAQAGREPSVPSPLPDIPSLMRDVEANQRKSESIEKDYLYHSIVTLAELDKQGRPKKVSTTEYDHLWIDGVPVSRLTRKDGRDLTPEESSKEDDRLKKDVAKDRERRTKADAAGKTTDPRGDEEVTVSRLLELGSFTNPRRVQINNRPTIAVDYAGDPRAHTHNRFEEVIRALAGTAWIDEQDHSLVRVEGRFATDFKLGAGLLADVKKGTNFNAQWSKINDEVWLPATINGQGSFHALLFLGFTGSLQIQNSNYRKFRTSSTIVPSGTPDPQPATSTPQ